jgi:hypothetical protein
VLTLIKHIEDATGESNAVFTVFYCRRYVAKQAHRSLTMQGSLAVWHESAIPSMKAFVDAC